MVGRMKNASTNIRSMRWPLKGTTYQCMTRAYKAAKEEAAAAADGSCSFLCLQCRRHDCCQFKNSRTTNVAGGTWKKGVHGNGQGRERTGEEFANRCLRCVSTITFLEQTCWQTRSQSRLTNKCHTFLSCLLVRSLLHTKLVCYKIPKATLLTSLSSSLLQKCDGGNAP
jgi:hypothetical protein